MFRYYNILFGVSCKLHFIAFDMSKLAPISDDLNQSLRDPFPAFPSLYPD